MDGRLKSMFVERKVRYSALFTDLVRWHASVVSFPLSDVILAQLACRLSDVMFCLHLGITNLSLYKHWVEIFMPFFRTFHFTTFASFTLFVKNYLKNQKYDRRFERF
jgi:hypothetical protein